MKYSVFFLTLDSMYAVRVIASPYHKRLLTCFVMNLKIVSKEFMSRVKQATKDVVKSEV